MEREKQRSGGKRDAGHHVQAPLARHLKQSLLAGLCKILLEGVERHFRLGGRIYDAPSVFLVHARDMPHKKLFLAVRPFNGFIAGFDAVCRITPPGKPFYHLEKSCNSMPLADLLERISAKIAVPPAKGALSSLEHPFCGEVYLGHLRYGTYGRRTLEACHPMVCDAPRRNRTLLAAGNFNLTNTTTIFNQLTALGYHPRGHQDCEVLLEKTRNTAPQSGTGSREERKTNIRDAYSPLHKEKIVGKTILLMDDIVTTGATLSECARVLRDAGAKQVKALTLARTDLQTLGMEKS